MSRSYRKTPITGMTTAHTEKQDKRRANRSERRTCRTILHCDPTCDEPLPHRREISDVWGFAKDGKQRFKPENHPDLMRK